MTEALAEILKKYPVIAAVKDEDQLDRSLRTNCAVVFLLFGDICGMDFYASKVKNAGKTVIAHMDLIQGLSNKEAAVDFLHRYTCVDGLISTRPQLLKYAQKIGLYTVLRVFLIDSLSMNNVDKQLNDSKADVLEIIPGLMPKIISKIAGKCSIPVIAGGLITHEEDVRDALLAGAACISTSCESLWDAPIQANPTIR